jgi:hypothetical protein
MSSWHDFLEHEKREYLYYVLYGRYNNYTLMLCLLLPYILHSGQLASLKNVLIVLIF